MTRKIYKWAKPGRILCEECERNIARGMPVAYVGGRAIHATCQSLYDAKVAS